MRIRLFFSILLITFLTCQRIAGQESSTVSAGAFTIPFQLTSANNLAVQAILNQKDTVRLMFHTAANAVTLTKESIQKLTSLRFEGADSVKSWGGNDNTSRCSKSNSLQIGQLKWEHVPIWENINSGPQTDGKFGTDLFAGKVVEIDFDKNIISVSSALPDKCREYEQLRLIFENDYMFIECSCQVADTVLKNKFLLHSGYAGAVLFDDQFTAENKLAEKLKITGEKKLSDSFGNILVTKKAVLPALFMGNEKLADVPAGFFQGAIGRQKMSIMGGDILKRFNIIIDAQRAHIYIKPNHLSSTAYTPV